MMRSAALVVVFAVTCLAAPVAQPAHADAPDPNAFTTSEFYLPSVDGTPLDAVLFRPANPPAKTPVILEVTPYLTTGGDPLSPQAAANTDLSHDPGSLGSVGRIFEKGYSYLIVSLRGFGSSGGCADFGGPGEQMDVIASVKWAARQPWSSGKVGMWGTSYPGGTQIMALAAQKDGYLGDELAAVIPKSPPTGFHNIWTAFENPVRQMGGGHLLPAYYEISDLQGPSVFDTPEHQATAIEGSTYNPRCYAGAVGSLSDDPDGPYWRAHDVSVRAQGAMVPTLWVQGFNDYRVRPSGMPVVFPTLQGPHYGIFGPWDHGIGTTNHGTEWYALAMRWYDRWLKNDTSVDLGPPVRVQDVHGAWHAETEWPPADAIRSDFPLIDGSYVDTAGNSGENDIPDGFGTFSPAPLPTGNGSWTFTTPLAHDVHVAGLTRVSATAGSLVPNVHMVALIYDVAPNGDATFVDRGAVRVPSAGSISFDLYPQDWTFPAGDRIGVLISGADDVFFEPGTSATPVSFSGASVSLPVVPADRPATTGPFQARGPHGTPIHVDPAGRETSWTPPATS